MDIWEMNCFLVDIWLLSLFNLQWSLRLIEEIVLSPSTTDLKMSATLIGLAKEETSVLVLTSSNIDSRSSLNLIEDGMVFLRINSMSIDLVHLFEIKG